MVHRRCHRALMARMAEALVATLHPEHANNYADSLISLHRFEEAKSVLRKIIPMARRVFAESHELTLRMRSNYVAALINAGSAMLDDLREAVTSLEDTEQTARRVLGSAHPLTGAIEQSLRDARAALRARKAGES